MRIELPSASWTDALQRVDDDAHTLTLAPEAAKPWDTPLPAGQGGGSLRADVGDSDPLTLTLTF